jgi:hypothetical protein
MTMASFVGMVGLESMNIIFIIWLFIVLLVAFGI